MYKVKIVIAIKKLFIFDRFLIIKKISYAWRYDDKRHEQKQNEQIVIN